jgi:hypothetical protein
VAWQAVFDNPVRGGTDLSPEHLFGRDSRSEEDLARAFKWITRTGAGPAFGSRPIGWYQKHQIAAIDILQDAATKRGMPADPRDGTWYFRLRNGGYQVLDYERRIWIWLNLMPSQVFYLADKKARM